VIALPALGAVLDAAQRAARRFPFVLASGVLSAIAGVLLVAGSEDGPYVRLLATATLGLPLCFALTLAGERRFAPGDARRWGVQAIGIVVLVLFWAVGRGGPSRCRSRATSSSRSRSTCLRRCCRTPASTSRTGSGNTIRRCSCAAAGTAAGEIYLTNLYATRSGGRWVVSNYYGELFLRLR